MPVDAAFVLIIWENPSEGMRRSVVVENTPGDGHVLGARIGLGRPEDRAFAHDIGGVDHRPRMISVSPGSRAQNSVWTMGTLEGFRHDPMSALANIFSDLFIRSFGTVYFGRNTL